MVKQRMPQSVKDSRELNDNEKRFIDKVERDNYSALDEHQLINEYLSVDQQSQLLKGKILLAIRNRFPNNHEFGDFIEKNLGTICSDTRQSRTRFMNLARFFETREIDKISISAAYEISAPINADIAVEVYNEVKGRNLPLAEVRRQIAIKKGTPNVSAVPVDDAPRFEDKYKPVGIVEIKKEVEIIPIETESKEKSRYDLIMEILQGLTGGEAKKLLRDCMHAVKW